MNLASVEAGKLHGRKGGAGSRKGPPVIVGRAANRGRRGHYPAAQCVHRHSDGVVSLPQGAATWRRFRPLFLAYLTSLSLPRSLIFFLRNRKEERLRLIPTGLIASLLLGCIAGVGGTFSSPSGYTTILPRSHRPLSSSCDDPGIRCDRAGRAVLEALGSFLALEHCPREPAGGNARHAAVPACCPPPQSGYRGFCVCVRGRPHADHWCYRRCVIWWAVVGAWRWSPAVCY